MPLDAHAKLGPAGRLALVELVAEGSPATAHRWWHRFSASEEDFVGAAQGAKDGCPLSKALASVPEIVKAARKVTPWRRTSTAAG